MTWFTSKSTYGSGGGVDDPLSSAPASAPAFAFASALALAAASALEFAFVLVFAFTVPSLPVLLELSGTADPLWPFGPLQALASAAEQTISENATRGA
jgi:hypothetical protein